MMCKHYYGQEEAAVVICDCADNGKGETAIRSLYCRGRNAAILRFLLPTTKGTTRVNAAFSVQGCNSGTDDSSLQARSSYAEMPSENKVATL